MNRDELGHFLRRRREALQPEDIGLPRGQRRRTAGLRREEVAALAHMSTDFYTRLEQARGSHPSQQTVGAIADALQLTPDERGHLFNLAGYTAPPRAYRAGEASPAMLRVLDQLEQPAQVVNDLGMTLRQNAAAVALLGVQTDYTGLERSLTYRWFTNPEERRIYPPEDHAFHSRTYVANLRAVHRRLPDDHEAQELIDALLERSPEFAQLWERHEVAVRADTRKRIAHPLVGLMTLDCQILTAQNETEKLVVFTADPGSEDASRLALLSVVGAAPLAEPSRF
jgi:transcriptional regulator with XRE-family HTH domain